MLARRSLAALLGVPAIAALGACSLLVSTSGLTGGDAGGATPDSGGADVATDSGSIDATADADARVDSGPPCDGGVDISGWSAFTKENGDVEIAGDTLLATTSTSAVGQVDMQNLIYQPNVGFAVLRMSYDMAVARSDDVYREPGCAIYLKASNGDQLLRELPYANHADFGELVNITKNGPTENLSRGIATLTNAASPHHIDMTIQMTGGKTLSLDTVFDGNAKHYDVTLVSNLGRFVLRCGVSYSEQQSVGTFSLKTAITRFALRTCD